MFNSYDKFGWLIGHEVVEYNGQVWLVTSEGTDHITIENDFSLDPNYREYSSATGYYSCVEDLRKNEVKPFCSILMNSGTDEEWFSLYKKLGLMFEESCVNESCCE